MDTPTAAKLKPSKQFIPCPVDIGDELCPNGIFKFNISKLLDHLAEHPVVVVHEKVRDLSRDNFARINESHIGTVDITRPIILAEIAPGRYNVIDGNHRLEKAKRLGVEEVPAYKLSPEGHMQFLTSEKAYQAYIKYWNGKVNDENKRKKRLKI